MHPLLTRPPSLRSARSGPDTDGKKVLLPSAEQWAPATGVPSKWRLAVYRTNRGLSKVPNFASADVSIVGYALVPYLNFKNLNDFRKVPPGRLQCVE